MDIDLKTIRELLAVVGETDITELTIESGDQRITVRKAAPGSAVTHVLSGDVAPPPPAATLHAPTTMSFEPKAVAVKPVEPPPPESANSNEHVSITSPMVGTFYRSSSPTSAPFVNVGDRVTVGQTVCIIEAMKLMNDMPSEVSGKIVKVLVDNGTTVEYGQPLFLIDPKG